MTKEEEAKKERIRLALKDAIQAWCQPGVGEVNELQFNRDGADGTIRLTGAIWDGLTEFVVLDLLQRDLISLDRPACRCPLATLMASGCRCGESFAEKIAKVNKQMGWK